MNSTAVAAASFFAGLFIALLAVFGGVNALTSASNPASASLDVVTYDK